MSINKQRIATLEALAERQDAPSDTEYNAAHQRMADSVRTHIQAALEQHEAGIEITEHIPTPEETADSAIIQAYNKFYNIPEDSNVLERLERKLSIIGKRISGEL